MKKIKNLLVPENKLYLLWVFLFILTILLFQIFLYPKYQKINRYNSFKSSYRNELAEMNNKIATAMIKKPEMEKIEANINEKMSYGGNILSSLKLNVVKKMPSSFVVENIFAENTYLSGEVQTIPITMEFQSNKKDLYTFLDNLSLLPLPVEIVSLKIDGLSPSKISVKIQMNFEKRIKA